MNNDYQQDIRILHTFAPNEPFGSLLEVSPKNHAFLKTLNLEFQKIKVWLKDQLLKIIVTIRNRRQKNLTLMIKYNSHYKNEIFNRA